MSEIKPEEPVMPIPTPAPPVKRVLLVDLVDRFQRYDRSLEAGDEYVKWSEVEALLLQRAQEIAELRAAQSAANPPCRGCGGPHPFDTVVPSVRWNAVIRKAGLPDYLCLTCIVSAFVAAGESFTAELVGEAHPFEPIEVRTRGQHAIDAQAVSRENTDLSAQLTARAQEIEQVRAELLKLETKWDERAADLSEGAMECAATGERSDERALMRRVNEINRCINDLRAFRVRAADAALVARAPQPEKG